VIWATCGTERHRLTVGSRIEISYIERSIVQDHMTCDGIDVVPKIIWPDRTVAGFGENDNAPLMPTMLTVTAPDMLGADGHCCCRSSNRCRRIPKRPVRGRARHRLSEIHALPLPFLLS
jgi:hypothetical protein